MGRRLAVAGITSMMVVGGSLWVTLQADKTPVHLCHYSKSTNTYNDIIVDNDSGQIKGHVNHINIGGAGDCRIGQAIPGDGTAAFPTCKAACNASPNGH